MAGHGAVSRSVMASPKGAVACVVRRETWAPEEGWHFSLSARRSWQGRSIFSRATENGPALRECFVEVLALLTPSSC